ncbi:hypothetical protein Fmac_015796 [Flemingia macrophylla]|uniref:Uncharacterized protein n=1 Tax=Flemingia macrophylla TaxID=520843 RepID=A0ABD1MFK5_9FABA
MVKAVVKPDVVTYSTLLEGYCQVNEVESQKYKSDTRHQHYQGYHAQKPKLYHPFTHSTDEFNNYFNHVTSLFYIKMHWHSEQTANPGRRRMNLQRKKEECSERLAAPASIFLRSSSLRYGGNGFLPV